MSNPFKYEESQIFRSIERMKKEYDDLENKYNTLLNIPTATPLIEKTKLPEFRKDYVKKSEIPELRAKIEEYRKVNIDSYEKNKVIISNNENAFKLLYDIMVRAKVPTEIWGTLPGKRKEMWITASWVNELKKAFPCSYQFTADDINRWADSKLIDLTREAERINKEEAQAKRDAEHKEWCSTRTKYLGALISKYKLPIESKKNDVILEMFMQNPFLRLASVFEGSHDGYIDTTLLLYALNDFDKYTSNSYSTRSNSIREAITRYDETADFDYISNCGWNYDKLIEEAKKYNEDVVKDYLELTGMG